MPKGSYPRKTKKKVARASSVGDSSESVYFATHANRKGKKKPTLAYKRGKRTKSKWWG